MAHFSRKLKPEISIGFFYLNFHISSPIDLIFGMQLDLWVLYAAWNFHAPTCTTARTAGKKHAIFGSFRTWGLYLLTCFMWVFLIKLHTFWIKGWMLQSISFCEGRCGYGNLKRKILQSPPRSQPKINFEMSLIKNGHSSLALIYSPHVYFEPGLCWSEPISILGNRGSSLGLFMVTQTLFQRWF